MKIILKSAGMLVLGIFTLVSCQKEENIGLQNLDTTHVKKDTKSTEFLNAYAITNDGKIYRMWEAKGYPGYEYTTVILGTNLKIEDHIEFSIAVDDNNTIYVSAKAPDGKYYMYKGREKITTRPRHNPNPIINTGMPIPGSGEIEFEKLYEIIWTTGPSFRIEDIEVHAGSIYGLLTSTGGNHGVFFFSAPRSYSGNTYAVNILNDNVSSDLSAPHGYLMNLASSGSQLKIIHASGKIASISITGYIFSIEQHQNAAGLGEYSVCRGTRGIMIYSSLQNSDLYKLYDYNDNLLLTEEDNPDIVLENVVNLGSQMVDLTNVTQTVSESLGGL